jgi:hypothetical protein
MAQTPPRHNSDAPIPLCASASAYEPGIWHGPDIAPPPQGVQTERGAERHRRCRWLPNVGKGSLIITLKRTEVRRRVSLG